MADGVPITAGTGTTIATDDTGATGHVQLVKLAYSADGSPTLITADANGLKVNASGSAVPVTDNGSSLTVDGTVSATQSGSWNVGLTPGNVVSVTDNGGSLTVDNSGTFAVQATVQGGQTNAASQVAVSNSSTSLVSARNGRIGLLIINQQSVAVYVDPSGGTASTTTSMRLDPGAAVSLPVVTSVTAITANAYTASGDAKVHVVEVY